MEEFKPESNSFEEAWDELSRLANEFINALIEVLRIEHLADWLISND